MIQTYNASKVAGELAEPIIPSLFDVSIIPPTSLGLMDIDILQQEIKSISGFDAFERVPELIAQTFGPGIRRMFPGIVVDNVIELNVTLNVNLRGDDGTNATNLLNLKRMKDLQFNRANGVRGLKKNCIWTMIVTRYNKDKSIWGVATMENCLFGPNGITGLDEVNIESNEAAVLSFTAISDKNMLELAATI
jgi:hypothetical protein